MKLKIIAVARHRNGIGGSPFHVAIFDEEEMAHPENHRKLAIVFDEPCHCAVLDFAKLAAGDITFSSNSWRGDEYEPHLRKAISDRLAAGMPGVEADVDPGTVRIVAAEESPRHSEGPKDQRSMNHRMKLKAEDLITTGPVSIHYSPGTSLLGILAAILNGIEFLPEIDLDTRLAENRQIAHVWGTDDVRQLRPDLDDDQAWAVLQAVADRLDSNNGITWNTVEIIADQLYPPAPHWEGRIDVRIADPDNGYGQGEVINRLRDMAGLLAKDIPGVEADVDPGSVRLFDHDETTSK